MRRWERTRHEQGSESIVHAALCVGGGWRGGSVGSEGAVCPPSGALASISVLLILPHPHFLLALREGAGAGMEGGMATKDQCLPRPRLVKRCYKPKNNTAAG